MELAGAILTEKEGSYSNKVNTLSRIIVGEERVADNRQKVVKINNYFNSTLE
jgi:hypothetical protein